MMRYPLASTTWDDAERRAIEDVVASGRFTMGPCVARFEDQFARYCGARHVVMVNSGSSANLLAVAALRYRANRPLRPGDEVIVPAVSWSTTYSPLYQYGLHLKFVDVDIDTLNYDLEQLARAVTDRTRLIVAVNLLGNPNDFTRLREIMAGREIDLIEDNCEAMGACYQGRMTGTFGLMGTFSTFFSHHISTMEGGMVATDDEELWHILLSLRAHGWTRDLPADNRVCGSRGTDEFLESFRFVLPGYNLRPLELAGAIGQEQLKKLPGFLAVRRQNTLYFSQRMRDVPHVRIQREIGQSSWFGFSLVLTESAPVARARVVEALAEAGIQCRPIVAGNFARNPVVSLFDHSIHGNLSSADAVDRRGLFVGNHHVDLEVELDLLRETLLRCLSPR